MKQIMLDHGARAITVKCLGGIPIQTLGYPCLGFSKLLDEGVVGACEADMDSTLTMLMFQYAFGLPGFISDPLIDTSKNAVIHAHCVAPLGCVARRSSGCRSASARIAMTTKAQSLEVFMNRDIGRKVTWAKLANLDTMLVTAGTITEICDFDDRGCRTQVSGPSRQRSSALPQLGCRRAARRHDDPVAPRRVLRRPERQHPGSGVLMGLKVVVEG